VVLAAGRGRRFSEGRGENANKLLAEWRGRPLIEWVLDTLSAAVRRQRLAGGLVVHRPDDVAIAGLARRFGFLPVPAPNADLGLSASLKTGLTALTPIDIGEEPAAALICLGDQPTVSHSTIELVMAEGRGDPAALIRPHYRSAPEVPGHPVLIGRRHWPLVVELDGDRGFGASLAEHGLTWTTVPVPGRNPDVDTIEDLESLMRSEASECE
jgi:CTP:molybdopterin cytidylyltransferase MocA